MEKPRFCSGRSFFQFILYAFIGLGLSLASTGCKEKVKPPTRDIVKKNEAWEERTAKNLRQYL